ncbi:MAG: class I SAM-dependent methyltransferase [Spirochaetia bacterium]
MEYGKAYYDWQREIGEFGAEADFFKIEDLLARNPKAVLEFGCGGGFWLAKIRAGRVLGVEVNPVARENCKKLGVLVVSDLADVEDDCFDVCFSHHALEHVENPLQTLQGIRTKLKTRGLLRLITPFDTSETFEEGDPNHHLYTWSVQNMGNLLTEAGFKVLEIRYLFHNWPNNFQKEYQKSKGRFHKLAVQTAKKKSIRQVFATAEKL